MQSWKPIDTAPELERVWVAGWNPTKGSTKGYYWYHEDTVYKGKAAEHPTATLWCPIVIPPFPVSG